MKPLLLKPILLLIIVALASFILGSVFTIKQQTQQQVMQDIIEKCQQKGGFTHNDLAFSCKQIYSVELMPEVKR